MRISIYMQYVYCNKKFNLLAEKMNLRKIFKSLFKIDFITQLFIYKTHILYIYFINYNSLENLMLFQDASSRGENTIMDKH